MTATYPTAPGAKSPGPSTDAASVITSKVATLRQQCFEVLFIKGDMTADEIALYLGADRLAIRPRLTELRALGRVFDSGKRRKNASGLSATVWTIHKPFSLE